VTIGQYLVERVKALLPPLRPLSGRGGWWPLIVREPFTGAWQLNQSLPLESVTAYSAVYACVTLIASDIGKLRLRLVAQDQYGIWTETQSPAFSPVLRKPNRYQTRITFFESWIVSKLLYGNAYILKQRDDRGVVTALYPLHPLRVQVLVSEDGAVFYRLDRDDLSSLPAQEPVTVPARDIIHDLMVPLFHPLIGVSPIFACGLAAMQGLNIQNASSKFFANGAQPSGILTAPGEIKKEQADKLKADWTAGFTGDNAGQIAVLAGGLKYEPLTMRPVDAQLIEQLNWTGLTVCTTFHMPAYKVGIGPLPTYNNIESLNQQYYADCLQSLIENIELCLDEGLELPKPFGTEFDLTDLLRMDTATSTKAAADGVASGCVSPNEARQRYFNLGPVPGGESPYMQQQYYSLEALSERDADQPFSKPTPAMPPAPMPDDDESDELEAAAFAGLLTNALEALEHAA
jgi:HK97 family phage portal protein